MPITTPVAFPWRRVRAAWRVRNPISAPMASTGQHAAGSAGLSGM